MRYLIVRLGSIGDIVHALPMAEALRAREPDAEVGWVVERALAPVLGMSPAVSWVVTIETRRVWRGRGWLPALRALRARPLDVAFDAQGLLKSALVARGSGARRVVGWEWPYLREGLARLFYGEAVGAAAAVHVIDKNLALLRAVGVDVTSRVVRLEEGEPAPHVVAAVPPGDRVVLVNAGGNWPNKRWPPDRFGALAAWLREAHGLRTLVLWGPGDEALADAVVAASGGAATRAPASTLADVVALARRAVVMVSGDTGPLHLACAVGTPVVGIYGPTDPRRNGPWHPDDRCASRFEVCRCHHRRACHATRWCLADVGVGEVQDLVTARLAAASRS